MKTLLPLTALLVVFTFSGAALANSDGHGKNEKDGMSTYLDKAIAKLPEKDAAPFRDTMNEAHEKNMDLADQVHGLHDDLDGIMKAESFDKDAFLAKSAKLRDVYEQMRENTDEAFADAVARLSSRERATIAAAMAYPHKKHGEANKAQ